LTPFPNPIVMSDGHCHNHGRLPARDPIYLAPTTSTSVTNYVAPTWYPDRHGNAFSTVLERNKMGADELELRHFARLALWAFRSTF